ncbi:MAG: excinuclease subunit [Chthoniobacter sp.]|jgi:excinuclease ABC subunit A|nr:excinuclease subunit [Chthoniobacter sp.]
MNRPKLTIVPDPGVIEIRGARQNNLKGIDLDLPLGKLNVISGPSGSGKSSLAFDTIYAEGQRRYVETFSPYTRQFLDRMDKPKVDEIRGIPPAIAIEQSNPVKSTRSTVGTMTEINDYLKLLFPRLAQAFCPECQREIRPETASSIVEEVFAAHGGETLLVTFGVPVPPKTEPVDFFAFLQPQGYLRVWLEGAIHRVDEAPQIKRLPPVVPVIQDRLTVSEENRSRFTEGVETALRFGKGRIAFVPAPTSEAPSTLNAPLPFSTGWHCAHCDLDITPPSPGLFSFNHPQGACPTCRGFGRTIAIDLPRAIPDRAVSIAGGAVKPFQTENGRECQADLMRCAAANEIDTMCPFEELSPADQNWVLYGERPGAKGEDLWEAGLWYGVKGFFDWLETKSYKMHVRVLLSRYRNYTLCPDCRGGRYQAATLNFRSGGKTLPELMGMPVGELREVFSAPRSGRNGQRPGDATTDMLTAEVRSRLGYLVEVGLAYLSLDRPTRTLSGGEVERVNLTTCLGASLVNTLFVLDEPSIGLHPRDTTRLIRVMQQLRDKGNTLLVVEHDEAVIRAADNLVEIGPGRGEGGGELVFSGPLDALLAKAGSSSRQWSLTADYLTGRKSIPIPSRRRKPRAFISVKGASEHNLQRIDADFPLGVFACVTGVSGSGKSTLVHDVLYRNLLAAQNVATEEAPGACKKLLGAHRLDQVVMIDQSPLSRTPRSSPALYLGVFDTIRELFATTPDAVAQGLTASSFSFNAGTGRCERCSGNGFEKVEMQFLSDVFIRCPECEGTRYQPHILQVRLEGKSIHEVLQLTVTEAILFFTQLRAVKVARPLVVLAEVGLGYLTLGQPLNVLSGGESQRLKLVERLTNQRETNCLLIFDEPTTGLHFDDVAQLVKVFERLVEQGNTVLVIEHNLEVIKCADYLIDLGPEAGSAGGLVVAAGTPEQVAAVEQSHTGRFLRHALRGAAVNGAPKMVNGEELARVAEEPPHVIHQAPCAISVHGAREHNLKNLSLVIPRDQMVIITGLSGSGKSTLAFDILFAEGQRRFLDSMSPYARQFVEQLEKPDVDLITGLPPSVAIEQRITRGGGKSTVATVTEVYHFLRLLFAKLGTQFCPKCDVPVEKQTFQAATKKAETIARGGRILVLAPLIKARKGFHTEVARWAERQGFEQLWVDGKFVRVEKFEKLDRFREHTIDVVVGERTTASGLQALVKRALEIGKGTAKILDAKNRVHVLSTEMSCPECGTSFEELDPRLFSFNSPHGWCPECHGFGEVWKAAIDPKLESAIDIEMAQERQHEWLDEGEASPCPSCRGARLNEIARHVRLQARTIDEFTGLSVRGALGLLAKLKFTGGPKQIAEDIVPEIQQRLTFMGQVGLDYLALSRSAKTLSGGESQRIRLAAQLGSNLRGVLYVLDEPTIGLHARDNEKLLDTLEALKRKGNSLVIVEHDEDTMRRADTIIDLGPGAGSRGGEVVAQGTLAEIQQIAGSATGRYLREPLQHPTRGTRRPLGEVTRWLELKGADLHNLKNVDVRFPLGRLSVVTGISGSGKSTLMRGVLKPLVAKALAPGRRREAEKTETRRGKKGDGEARLGIHQPQPYPVAARINSSALSASKDVAVRDCLEAVYEVDQSPIGKTSRSTPGTYIKVFDEIRALFAQMPLSRMRGYTASRFSFNAEGGRCETCQGQGVIKVEMNFLPTSYVPCTDCHGRRYNAATLEALYNERSIGDVMEMTIEQAADFFQAQPRIHRPLALLCETGLGYLKLGQPSPTLSGGEAQRLKLVSELTRGLGRTQTARLRQNREAKSTLYLLEEPTIGLHMADVAELLKVFHRLVDDGNTVIVIEHNLSLIADADYVVDIGPEAGDEGGELVASGTPEEVARSKRSRTAPFLRAVLSNPDRPPAPQRARRAPAVKV